MKEFLGTDRFEIMKRLGAGGMGVVYLAHDRERFCDVALKTLPELTPGALYRFKQEFRAVAGLAHPNLIKLYELFAEGDGQWFFTMEYLGGVDFLHAASEDPVSETAGSSSHSQTATATIATPDDIPTPELVERMRLQTAAGTPVCHNFDRLRSLLRQVAEGIAALHQSGRLHRDIKPSNILVEPDGRAVVLDFGLAQEKGADEFTIGRIAGTYAYMAPEQFLGFDLTEAADWYAVGVVLYQALSGTMPHQAADARGLQRAKLTTDARRPRWLRPDVPADLDELCMRLLDRDPSRRPPGPEIIEGLGGPEAAVNRQPPASRVFVGRVRELDRLSQAWSDLRRGATMVVEVSGNSGVGKSALVQQFLSGLEQRERPVILRGRCYEQESVPFKAMDSVIDGLARYLRQLPDSEVPALLPREATRLTQLFPVLDRVEALRSLPARTQAALDAPELRRRAFQALRELLSRIGDRSPLIVSIDDLQWGDDDSALLLTELLRPPDAPAMMLLLAYRSEDAGRRPELRALFQQLAKLGIERRPVPVDALPEEDARQLATRLLGQSLASEQVVGAIARESGGNAYFVRELAAGVGAEGGRPAGIEHLDELIWNRACKLAPEARELLETIAVAGQPVEQRVAFQASGASAWNLGTLGLLRSEHLLRSSGWGPRDDVETYHDRIRESILGHLSSERLTGLHLALARALEAHRGADPETLATHFDGGGDAGSAGHYYLAAGESAAKSLAFRLAARLLAKALEKLNPASTERGELLAKLATAEANAGLNAQAGKDYREAAACLPGAQWMDLMRKAAYQYCSGGYVDEGTAAFAEVLSRVSLKLPGSSLAALVKRLSIDAWLTVRGTSTHLKDAARMPVALLERLESARLASTGLGAVDPITASYFTALSLALALRAAEPERLLRCLCWEAVVQASFNEHGRKRAARYLQEAQRLTGHTAQPQGRAFFCMAEGIVAFSAARFLSAAALLREAEAIFSACPGAQWELAMVRTYQAWNRVQQGCYREMGAVVPAQFTDARERGDLFMAVNLGQFPYLITLLVQDRTETAAALLDECEALWRPKGYQVQVPMGALGRCWLEIYRGNGRAAWDLIDRHWRLMRKNLFHLLENLAIYLGEARARAALLTAEHCLAAGGDAAPYLAEARRDAARLRRKKLAHGPVMALVIEAGVAALQGNGSGAIAFLRRAVDGYERLGQLMLANTARRRLGQWQGGAEGARLVDEAESWLAKEGVVDIEAITRFHACGLCVR